MQIFFAFFFRKNIFWTQKKKKTQFLHQFPSTKPSPAHILPCCGNPHLVSSHPNISEYIKIMRGNCRFFSRILFFSLFSIFQKNIANFPQTMLYQAKKSPSFKISYNIKIEAVLYPSYSHSVLLFLFWSIFELPFLSPHTSPLLSLNTIANCLWL